MAFSFLQRGNLADHARQLSLATYEPALTLEDLVPGIDNVRHDVFLSPKFTDAARFHIFKLIAKHGNVEELAAEEAAAVRLRARMPARSRNGSLIPSGRLIPWNSRSCSRSCML